MTDRLTEYETHHCWERTGGPNTVALEARAQCSNPISTIGKSRWLFNLIQLSSLIVYRTLLTNAVLI
jgi:hypothetical protein